MSNVIAFPGADPPKPTPTEQDEAFNAWAEVEVLDWLGKVSELDDFNISVEEFWDRARAVRAQLESWPWP